MTMRWISPQHLNYLLHLAPHERYNVVIFAGTDGKDLGTIFLAKNKFSALGQPFINTFQQLMVDMGINVIYKYGSDCFDEPDSVLKPSSLGL